MTVRIWPLLAMFAWLPGTARAQVSVHDLREPGQFGAFLTPGQIDRWVFEGEKGETVVAHVATKEFDPVLELAGAKDDDKPILEANEPGGQSQYMFRLPEKGQYRIRVRAFKYQGGGNYSLAVQRFEARELVVGKPSTGSFDRAGKGYHYFQGAKDQILVPQLKGAHSGAWKLLDIKGRPTANWAGTGLIEQDGECCLVVSGPPGHRYDLLLNEARQREVANGKDLAGSLRQGEMDAVNFEGKPGDFRVLEVEKKGEFLARLKHVSDQKKSLQRIAKGDRPEIEFLPVASRGNRLRFAAILGREGKYQLQLLASTPASYALILRDPTLPIEPGKEAEGNLPVGSAAFYGFKASPGQLFQASLASGKFVPLLRLYDAQGSLVESSGEEGDGAARVTHMVLNEGLYRLQVASLGDGGGGEFRQSLKETKLKELPVGGRGQGTVEAGATDFWTFAGKEGQTVFLSVRSDAFEPAVSLRSPDGVQLAADGKGNSPTGSLLALKLPRTGRYTVWISSSRGAGEYKVRLIDGD